MKQSSTSLSIASILNSVINTLTKIGPSGESVDTPSICLLILPSNEKAVFVHKLVISRYFSSCLF